LENVKSSVTDAIKRPKGCGGNVQKGYAPKAKQDNTRSESGKQREQKNVVESPQQSFTANCM